MSSAGAKPRWYIFPSFSPLTSAIDSSIFSPLERVGVENFPRTLKYIVAGSQACFYAGFFLVLAQKFVELDLLWIH